MQILVFSLFDPTIFLLKSTFPEQGGVFHRHSWPICIPYWMGICTMDTLGGKEINATESNVTNKRTHKQMQKINEKWRRRSKQRVLIYVCSSALCKCLVVAMTMYEWCNDPREQQLKAQQFSFVRTSPNL